MSITEKEVWEVLKEEALRWKDTFGSNAKDVIKGLTHELRFADATSSACIERHKEYCASVERRRKS